MAGLAVPVPGCQHWSSARPDASAPADFLLGVSHEVLCAELCTSSFLLSGKELEVFQGEEASNLFAHDRSENSITTLPW